MSTAFNLIPPDQWIPIALIGLSQMMINCFVLTQECKKRISNEVKYTTTYLQIWSLLSMISGALCGFVMMVQHLNGFCHFAQHLAYTFVSFQGVFMGYYQLSRLYYCFAESKVYSNKGYPDYLFAIMYTIGIFVIFSAIICPWFILQLPIICGINDEFQYDDVSKVPAATNISFSSIFIGSVIMIALLWDFTTLSLYIIKMVTIQNYQSRDVNHNRVMSILNRIIILTIFYEITAVIFIFLSAISGRYGWSHIIALLYNIGGGLGTISISYSMFLMQEHNNKEYKRFLKLLYCLKFHYTVCCCFRSIIVNYDDIETEHMEKETKDLSNDDTTCDTRDKSIKNEHTNIFELSSKTNTMQKTISV